MAVFQYTGLLANGQSATGIIDADSPKGARLKLRRDGIYPTDVVERDSTGTGQAGAAVPSLRGKALSQQELAVLTRQLGTLLIAGLPLVEALAVLVQQSGRPQTQSLLADLREQIRQGKTMSAAMEGYPKVFPPLYVHMIRAGEASGALDQILFRLADFLDQYLALKNKLINAALYPVIMLTVGVTVLLVLLTFVVPKITAVFADLGHALPWQTRLLIGVSDFFRDHALLLLTGVALLGLALQRTLRSDRGRWAMDRFVLRIPLLGALVAKSAIARFAKTLATMLASGVPLLEGLAVAKRVMNNRVLEDVVDTARERIREGHSFADPLKRSGLFPALVPHLIAVGEKSGELEGMLQRIAQIFDSEVERIVMRATTLLEPAMILVMGVIVFFIVVAILLPIFEMSQLVS